MSPALLPGDRLLAVRRPPAVGQIAVFAHPFDPRIKLVKRVVAGPGWDVRLVEAELQLTAPDGTGSMVRVPVEHRPRVWSLSDDEVFALSDAVDGTRADSRVFGPLPIGSAMTVVFRYRPLGRMHRFE